MNNGFRPWALGGALLVVLSSVACRSGAVAPRRRPIHQYSFNEQPAAPTAGATIRDAIGDAHGSVLGEGARFSGTRLVLPGGAREVAAYVALPSGLLSRNGRRKGGTGAISVEIWFKVIKSAPWARIFDFGSMVEKKRGGDFLMYSAQVDDDLDLRRLAVHHPSEDALDSQFVDTVVRNSVGTDRHLVVTWVEATSVLDAYENGERVATLRVRTGISEIDDANVWIGRSQFEADPNLAAALDELRIYDYALSAAEIEFDWRHGPGAN